MTTIRRVDETALVSGQPEARPSTATAPTLTATTTPIPRPKRRPRKHYYAILATRDEVRLPKRLARGYLERSRLIQAAQRGDDDALREVWLDYARLAYSIANKVRGRPDVMADFVQEAQLAVPRAIRGFDVERLLEFSTYCFIAMRRDVQRASARIIFAVRVPNAIYGEYHEYRKRSAAVLTPAEWYDLRDSYLDTDPKLYERLVRIHVLAVPQPLDSAANAIAELPPVHARFLADERQKALEAALSGLDERDRYVLKGRFGLLSEDGIEVTLSDLGDQLGVTKEAIRQIQNRALNRLREALEAAGWGDPEDVLGPLSVP